jgi:acetyltransferase-like isoleucine patch superfamily enzyme
MNVFVHEHAICETSDVGDGTRVWAFAHILPGARVGQDCNICDHVFIENDVVVGDRVTIKSGVQLWDGVRLEDDVFVGPNVTFTNDPFPRSKQYLDRVPITTIGVGASLGANATVLPGVSVGRLAMVGAGAVVTKSVPANSIVVGNPARIVGYVGAEADEPSGASEPAALARSRVPGAALIAITRADDLRGSLVAANFLEDLPFVPRRFFAVYGVSSENVRGEHAHKECEQFLVCISGKVHALVDDGWNRQEFVLDRPDVGLYVKPMIWGTQYRYSQGAVLLVFASHAYDPNDYIRDHEEFLQVKGRARKVR